MSHFAKKVSFWVLIVLLLPISINLLVIPKDAISKKLPSKITWIVPYSLGGGTGTSALVLAPRLQRNLAKYGVEKVEVISVSGAGGAVGVKKGYNSKPDGSVIGSMLPGGGLAQSVVRDVGFEIGKFRFLGKIATSPRFIFVKGDSSINSFKDFLIAAKKKPLKLSASGKTGATSFALANIIENTGIKVRVVPGYKGGRKLIVAVAKGDVDFTIKSTGGVVKFIRDGDVKGLVQLAPNKLKDPFFPNIPTAEELGRKDLIPGGVLHILIYAPPKTPNKITKLLREGVHQALLDSKEDLLKQAQVAYAPLSGEKTQILVNQFINDFRKLVEIHKRQQKQK